MLKFATEIWIHSEKENTYQVSLLLSPTEIIEYKARLMTVKEFEQQDRSEGSIFDALSPGEEIQLDEGLYILNENLDLMNPDQFFSKSDRPMTEDEKDEIQYEKYMNEVIAREQDLLEEQTT